jgi:hypothetical protein
MAAISGPYKSLSTLTAIRDSNGERPVEAEVAEILEQNNPVDEVLLWRSTNRSKHHETLKRVKLPEVYERKVNQAIPYSKQERGMNAWNTVHLEAQAATDVMALEGLNAAEQAFEKMDDARAFLQAMAIKRASLIFNGSADADVQRMGGIFDIYSTVNLATSAIASQVVDAGGTGSDNTTMMLADLSANGIFGIYPKESKNMGIKVENLGVGDVPALDINGNAGFIRADRSQFGSDLGICVNDYTLSTRVANIDLSDLKGDSAPSITELALEMYYKAKNVGVGKKAIFLNSTLAFQWHLQDRREVKAGGQLSFEMIDGKKRMMFMGIPVIVCDAIANNYARVV